MRSLDDEGPAQVQAPAARDSSCTSHHPTLLSCLVLCCTGAEELPVGETLVVARGGIGGLGATAPPAKPPKKERVQDAQRRSKQLVSPQAVPYLTSWHNCSPARCHSLHVMGCPGSWHRTCMLALVQGGPH